MKTICVIQEKGGCAKSTTAFQVCSAYFLAKKEKVQLLEMDNQNKDAEAFQQTAIETKQVYVDQNQKDLNATVRDIFLSETEKNRVMDIGGNQTSTAFLQALDETKMHNMIDLFVIPISSGFQDLKNAKKVLEKILTMDKNANVVFAISRSRHAFDSERVKYQFSNFFNDAELTKFDHFILQDSDAVDLSRNLQKSIYELSVDEKSKKILEGQLDEAFTQKDKKSIYKLSLMLEIHEDAIKYAENDLKQAFAVLGKALKKDEKGAKDE
jgi:hypothetical protein